MEQTSAGKSPAADAMGMEAPRAESMPARDRFRAEISRSQRMLRCGMGLTLSGFVLLAGAALFHSEPNRLGWLQVLLAGTALAGFIIWVYSILRLRGVIRCPGCGKPLNYLLVDPSYSKRAVQFGLPDDLPAAVTACPYCRAELGESKGESP